MQRCYGLSLTRAHLQIFGQVRCWLRSMHYALQCTSTVYFGRPYDESTLTIYRFRLSDLVSSQIEHSRCPGFLREAVCASESVHEHSIFKVSTLQNLLCIEAIRSQCQPCFICGLLVISIWNYFYEITSVLCQYCNPWLCQKWFACWEARTNLWDDEQILYVVSSRQRFWRNSFSRTFLRDYLLASSSLSPALRKHTHFNLRRRLAFIPRKTRLREEDLQKGQTPFRWRNLVVMALAGLHTRHMSAPAREFSHFFLDNCLSPFWSIFLKARRHSFRDIVPLLFESTRLKIALLLAPEKRLFHSFLLIFPLQLASIFLNAFNHSL